VSGRVPTKAIYLEMESNPDLEFDHFLAEKLHMTVDELRTRMSADEYARWIVYYQRKGQRQDLALKAAKR